MTIDELRDRKRELLARKKYELELQDRGEGDNLALFMVNEELLDLNAQLKALTPGKRVGGVKKVPAGEKDWALDRRQFLDWQETAQSLDDEIDEGRQRLRKAAVQGLDRLTPKQRRILTLYLQGIPGTEIAQKLGVNKSTVSRILRRAKHKVRADAEQTVTGAGIRDEKGRVDLLNPAAAKAVLSVLTPKQAVYFYLYFAEWLSVREIGALTGTDYSAIFRTIRRALERIGRLLGDAETVLEHPEALDELAYQIYCELEDHPERLPDKMPRLQKYKPPAAAPHKPRPPEKTPPLPVRVAAPPRGPRTPGKLLSALLERVQNGREAPSQYPVFRWLEAVFAAFRDKFTRKQ